MSFPAGARSAHAVQQLGPTCLLHTDVKPSWHPPFPCLAQALTCQNHTHEGALRGAPCANIPRFPPVHCWCGQPQTGGFRHRFPTRDMLASFSLAPLVDCQVGQTFTGMSNVPLVDCIALPNPSADTWRSRRACERSNEAIWGLCGVAGRIWSAVCRVEGGGVHSWFFVALRMRLVSTQLPKGWGLARVS